MWVKSLLKPPLLADFRPWPPTVDDAAQNMILSRSSVPRSASQRRLGFAGAMVNRHRNLHLKAPRG